jgi:FixJ family two-component response regulator
MTLPVPVVYVVDDDAAEREVIRNLLDSVSLKAETFASQGEFLGKARLDNPSCLVLDIRLPGDSGLDFPKLLSQRGIHIPTIFITGHADTAMSIRAMKEGAVEFLIKPFRDQELLDAVNHALDLDRAYRVKYNELSKIRARYAQLTPRQKQVLELVVAGLSNSQIALELGVRQATVKVHRGQVVRKMQAKSVPDLVRLAEQVGVPQPRSRSFGTNS